MGKTLEELLLGAESQAAVSKAVQDAVERADAAGLVPAFEPYVSLSKHLSKEEVLELRRQARAEKARRDQEDLEFHRVVVELLYPDGQVNEYIKSQALERVQLWETRQTCIPRYCSTWREWLAMPPDFARRAILNETDLGVSMRCNTPFDFLRGAWNQAKGQGDQSQIETRGSD